MKAENWEIPGGLDLGSLDPAIELEYNFLSWVSLYPEGSEWPFLDDMLSFTPIVQLQLLYLHGCFSHTTIDNTKLALDLPLQQRWYNKLRCGCRISPLL